MFLDEVVNDLQSKTVDCSWTMCGQSECIRCYPKNTKTSTEIPKFEEWIPGGQIRRGKIITYEPSKEIGVKDSQKIKKAPIFTFCKQMKNAIEQLSFRTEYGHEKYLEFDADYNNFARVENGDEEYGNAQFRHALNIGEDTELEHYVASAWDSIARLEIYLRNKVK